jgi:hypothetical protein
VFTVAAIPVLFQADLPPLAANSTLKCYDHAGNAEPCGTRARGSSARLDGPAAGAHQPPSWITTALYQEPNWATPALDQPANEPASAPAARHSTRLRRHPASAACQRRVIPCFFSALRRGVTHLASVAAEAAQARPARAHL